MHKHKWEPVNSTKHTEVDYEVVVMEVVCDCGVRRIVADAEFDPGVEYEFYTKVDVK